MSMIVTHVPIPQPKLAALPHHILLSSAYDTQLDLAACACTRAVFGCYTSQLLSLPSIPTRQSF